MSELRKKILSIPLYWEGKPLQGKNTIGDFLDDGETDAILSTILQALPEKPHPSYLLVPKEHKAWMDCLSEVRNIITEAMGEK